MPHAPLTLPEGAVLLAGGTGRRLGGADKARLLVGEQTLLERALAAVTDIRDVVVVGPEDLPTAGVPTVREEPAYGGPAAGLLTGVRALPDAATVLVLAVDMPRVTPGTVRRLTAALAADADGAVLHDVRRQPLCAVYRRTSLLAAAPADPGGATGLAVHRLLATLRLVEVPALPGEGHDVDTWADLLAAEDS